MQGVRAIGLKLVGVDGSCSAAAFPISFTDALFHIAGITDPDQQELNRSCRATSSVGHFLKMMYGMPSKGHGADVDLAFLTAVAISSILMVSQSKSTDGVGEKASMVGAQKSVAQRGMSS